MGRRYDGSLSHSPGGSSGRADYLLSNGGQSVLPEPLSEAKTWVVWIGVEPDQEPARAAFAKTSTAASTTTMANESLVVRQ
jgi:hypothetical protein